MFTCMGGIIHSKWVHQQWGYTMRDFQTGGWATTHEAISHKTTHNKTAILMRAATYTTIASHTWLRRCAINAATRMCACISCWARHVYWTGVRSHMQPATSYTSIGRRLAMPVQWLAEHSTHRTCQQMASYVWARTHTRIITHTHETMPSSIHKITQVCVNNNESNHILAHHQLCEHLWMCALNFPHTLGTPTPSMDGCMLSQPDIHVRVNALMQ